MSYKKFLSDDESKWDGAESLEEMAKPIERGLRRDEGTTSEDLIVKNRLGICAKCEHASWSVTEFGNVTAMCWHFELRLSGKDKIKRCTSFSPKGHMNLATMASLAWLIEAPKDVPGFIPEPPKKQPIQWKEIDGNAENSDGTASAEIMENVDGEGKE